MKAQLVSAPKDIRETVDRTNQTPEAFFADSVSEKPIDRRSRGRPIDSRRRRLRSSGLEEAFCAPQAQQTVTQPTCSYGRATRTCRISALTVPFADPADPKSS